jgi:hypothetical protein
MCLRSWFPLLINRTEYLSLSNGDRNLRGKLNMDRGSNNKEFKTKERIRWREICRKGSGKRV